MGDGPERNPKKGKKVTQKPIKIVPDSFCVHLSLFVMYLSVTCDKLLLLLLLHFVDNVRLLIYPLIFLGTCDRAEHYDTPGKFYPCPVFNVLINFTATKIPFSSPRISSVLSWEYPDGM